MRGGCRAYITGKRRQGVKIMKTTNKNSIGSVVSLLAMMIVPLVTSGSEAVTREALVGQ